MDITKCVNREGRQLSKLLVWQNPTKLIWSYLVKVNSRTKWENFWKYLDYETVNNI